MIGASNARQCAHPFNLIMKIINPRGGSTELLENWWVTMFEMDIYWTGAIDTWFKYIGKLIDGWMITIVGTLSLRASSQGTCSSLLYLVHFTAKLDGHCLHLIYSYCLSSDCNTKPIIDRLLILGLPRAQMACLSDTKYDSTGFCSCVLLMYFIGEWCAQFDLM